MENTHEQKNNSKKESFNSPKNVTLGSDSSTVEHNAKYYPRQHDTLQQEGDKAGGNKIASYTTYFNHILLGILGLVGFIISAGALKVTQKKLISRGVIDGQCLYEKGNSLSFSEINPYSVLGFSLSLFLLIALYEVSLGLQYYCKKSYFYSPGGQLFIHLCLSIIALIIGIFIFSDHLLDVCSCISKNYYCNLFRITGIICIICCFLFVLNALLAMYFYRGICNLIRFLTPNSNSYNTSNSNNDYKKGKSFENNMNESRKYNARSSMGHSSNYLHDDIHAKSPKSPRADYVNV